MRQFKRRLKALLVPALCPLLLPWFYFSKPNSALQRVHKLILMLEAERIRREWGTLQVIATGLFWPLLVPLRAFLKTLRVGCRSLGARRVSILRQWLDQVWFAETYNISPSSYYRSRFFHFDGDQKDIITPEELRLILGHLNRDLDWDPVDHKVVFYEHCMKHRLSTAPLLAIFEEGSARWIGKEEQLPQRSLFLKPTNSSGGKGSERWSWLGDGTWRQEEAGCLDEQGLLKRVVSLSQSKPYLLQPCLENHPSVSALGGQTICTVRIATCKSPLRSAELLCAEFRMPTGSSWVDNVSAGGMAAFVDLGQGRLGEAFSGKFLDLAVEKNPLTGKRIVDFNLPFWQEAAGLCCEAHETFPDFAFIGWDVGLLADGPVLIEANTLWGPPVPCLLGQTQFADCVLENLEA